MRYLLTDAYVYARSSKLLRSRFHLLTRPIERHYDSNLEDLPERSSGLISTKDCPRGVSDGFGSKFILSVGPSDYFIEPLDRFSYLWFAVACFGALPEQHLFRRANS